MTASLTELKRNAKLQSWYEDIEERKSRKMSVEDWCQYRFCSKSTYYYRQQKVLQALDAQLNKQESQVEFTALPAPIEAEPVNFSEEKIVLGLGERVLEIPDGTSREIILALLAGMKC
ncbi:MAG: hypothetical protein GX777_05870 [Fastidiosipila sp.]|nr:hypothetical protein [Fastidiosipila sp.]